MGMTTLGICFIVNIVVFVCHETVIGKVSVKGSVGQVQNIVILFCCAFVVKDNHGGRLFFLPTPTVTEEGANFKTDDQGNTEHKGASYG